VLELEFIDAGLPFVRECELEVRYKKRKLKHMFCADFLCFENIIVEVKSCDRGIIDDHIGQTLNYLKVSHSKIGMIINFGKRRLEFKRLIS
jgi:GxxExxY protein